MPSEISASRVGYIVPTLGSNLDWIGNALESIRRNGEELKIVVVASSLSDELQAIAEKSNASLIKEEGNTVFAALNQGVEFLASEIDIFAFLGDDDELLPDATAKLLRQFNSEDTVVAYGAIWYVNQDGELIMKNPGYPLLARFVRWLPNLIPNPGTLIRVSAWQAAGRYDPELRFAGDLDLWIRISKLGHIAHVPEVISRFRFHHKGLTAGQREQSLAEARAVRARYATGLSRPFQLLSIRAFEELGELAMKLKMGAKGSEARD